MKSVTKNNLNTSYQAFKPKNNSPILFNYV